MFCRQSGRQRLARRRREASRPREPDRERHRAVPTHPGAGAAGGFISLALSVTVVAVEEQAAVGGQKLMSCEESVVFQL